MLNLLYNQTLLRFTHSLEDGPVKRLSFSTDTSLGVSLLASISISKQGGCHVFFWDLNHKKIYSKLENGHSGH